MQGVLGDLEEVGFGVYAISYDRPEVLADFGRRHGIRYLLLGDPGSRNLERAGLLDHEIERHQREFGIAVAERHAGLAYPAVFVLDGEGVIRQKRVQRNYRWRESGRALLAAALEPGREPEPLTVGPALLMAEPVRVKVVPEVGYYRAYMINRFAVSVELAPGLHIYSEPIPAGYVPFSIEVAPEAWLIRDGLDIPVANRELRLAGLDEVFRTYDRSFEATVPIAVPVLPGKGGEVEVRLAVRYQACTESECYPPESREFKFSMREREPDSLIE